MNWETLLALSLVTSTTSVTVTKAKIFLPFRNRIKWKKLGELFHCPYCLSHWIALLLVLIYGDIQWLFLEVFIVVAIATAFSLIILKSIKEME